MGATSDNPPASLALGILFQKGAFFYRYVSFGEP